MCNNPSYTVHKPIRDNSGVDTFPEHVPNEVNSVLNYKPGTDKDTIPFNPSAQTARNAGFV